MTATEIENTVFFKAGATAAREGRSLLAAIACMRPGCWQYEAFIAGFDSVKAKK